MRLIDLDPKFLRYEERIETWRVIDRQPTPGERTSDIPTHEVTGPRQFYIVCQTIDEAHGVEFACPKCFMTNGSLAGTHGVICWSSSRGVPEHARPSPGRWKLVGTGFHDLSLMEEPGKSRSVLLLGGCQWHGFVTNGETA